MLNHCSIYNKKSMQLLYILLAIQLELLYNGGYTYDTPYERIIPEKKIKEHQHGYLYGCCVVFKTMYCCCCC